ncbi:hypothetical protein [Burkholderia gladioli]|uniref:hypothetical protein n=1 Tax=Burkholderia gladioli TaxID=28095 RepID=UPI001641EE73|nr:hypothetical protein [Burkholderia gladioli]
MSIFDEVAERLASQVASTVSKVTSGFSLAGTGRALVQTAVGHFAPSAASAVNKALHGDYLGAALDGLKKTALGSKINSILNGSLISELLFNSTHNPLFGGVTVADARAICEEVQATQYAKRNLYFIEIVDFYPDLGGSLGLESSLFNLFATHVSIGPMGVVGDAINIGSAVVDSLHAGERLEIRLTTLDDAAGSIKKWWQTRQRLTAKPDGTFGVPADYLLQVRILHAAINDDVMTRYGGYEQVYVMRCGTMETDLSRSEDALQEIQLSFVQFDTFMYNQG